MSEKVSQSLKYNSNIFFGGGGLHTYNIHSASSLLSTKTPIFTILLFSFADRKEVKLQL